MNEKQAKRREWVKTAAIVFLSVMLILTFFSNTIMNYSLPEVAAQYITSGTITAKIRGTGMVESGSLYNVKVTESRKVLSVEVRVGDTVQVGDVICYLVDTESDELKNAREQLEGLQEAYQAAQDTYNQALLTGGYSTAVIQNAGSKPAVSVYREQILQLQNEIAAQQAVVDDWNKQVYALQIKIDTASSGSGNTVNEQNAVNSAQAARDSLDTQLQAAKNKLASLEAQLENPGNSDPTELENQIAEQEAAVASLNTQLENAEITLANAKTALAYKQNSGSNELTSMNNQMDILQVNLRDAEKTLADKKDVLTQLTTDITGLYQLNSLYEVVQNARADVAKQQEVIAGLEDKAIGATVTAEVAGTITSVSVVGGENTSPDIPVVTIQPEGKGYTLSFSVTNEQAQKISVGDPAELVNSWWYNDVTATVASIRPDPSSPNNQKLVTFNLTGSSLTAGQTLSLQVGERNASYDNIVPNSAIREDNNGKFILVVETKSSPLGNRYYATRYDVEVLASDDTQSAIRGAIYGYEYVITTATKPVEAGQMVRLPD